jgi:uncharacterized membrane protein
VAWVSIALGIPLWLSRARRSGRPEEELAARRRLQPALLAEHAALLVLLLSGLALLWYHGWGLGHARWLALKLGLVAFLVLPLEAIHATISHLWLARGLRQTTAPPFSKDLERAIGMDDMVRVIAIPLLGLGLPLIVWLSMAQPF